MSKIKVETALNDMAGIPVPINRVQSELDLADAFIGYYFKDAGTRPWPQLISGLPLPLDADGVCRNRTFVNCEFHPCCSAVKFERCEFINCEEPKSL